MLKDKAESKKYQMDMCNGSVLKKMLIFTIPLMLSSLLQLLFNAADIVVLGQFAGDNSDNSIAAVGSTSALINLMVNLFIGLSVGANVLTARYYGAKNKKAVGETVHTAIYMGIISGVALAIIGVVGTPTLLSLMKTPDKVIELSIIYLRIYFLGMPAMMVYNFGAAILRAVGDTKRPLYFLCASGVINVLLNLIFVIALNMDVAGVALATTISQFISAFLIIRCLVMEQEQSLIKLNIKELKMYKDKLTKILKIGLPAGLQGTLFSLSNVVIQSSINSFGEVVVAGSSAAANIEGFVYVSMNSFYQSTISFTSQNVGAGKYERINRILFTALACVIIVGTVFGNTVAFFGTPLLKLYSNNSAVIEAGLVRLRLISTVYALCGMMDVLVGSLRGMGYSIVPTVVSLVGACLLRIIFLTTLFKLEPFHKIEMVYLTYAVSWTITIIAHVITFIIAKKIINKRSYL